MLSCKEVSYLASKAIDVPLTWRERWSMRLHLLFCNLCRRYVRDLRFLRRAPTYRREGETQQLMKQAKLSGKARERIQRALDSSD